MADAATIPDIGQIIAAVGALGAAAYGLVDATKAFGGGVSLRGLHYVDSALKPFDVALAKAVGGNWRDVVKAHWINGRPKAEQKAIAKALIRLGLDSDSAGELAKAGGVDGTRLKDVAEKLAVGNELSAQDLNLLGRFDATVDAKLDAAFERADQSYRNSAKCWAAVVSVVLAVTGSTVVGTNGFDWSNISLAILIGLLAVPLAPVAKDVSSALSAAVSAMQIAKGRKS